MGEKEDGAGEVMKRKKGSILSIFTQADGVDLLFMALGFIGAVCDGFAGPVVLLVMGDLMNSFGTASDNNEPFTRNINKVSSNLYYLLMPSFLSFFGTSKQNKG